MLTSSISVKTPLLGTAPVAGLTSGKVGSVAAPAVAHGQAINGTVCLSGPPGANFSKLRLTVQSWGVRKSTQVWEAVPLATPLVVALPLAPDKTYALDASGAIEMPFSVPAGVLPCASSFGIPDVACVQHQLVVEVEGSELEALPLAVQVLTPPPAGPTANDKPWMTVGDFGGEAKLMLHGAASTAWPLNGCIEGELLLRGTTPLVEVKVLLMRAQHGAEETAVVAEATVWEASDPTVGEAPERTFPIKLPLSSTSLCPSVPLILIEDGTVFGVSYFLRMHLSSADKLAGWNTLPVELSAGSVLLGAPAPQPAATAASSTSLPAPKCLASPFAAKRLQQQRTRRRFRLAALVVLLVGYCAADAKLGLGSRLGGVAALPAQTFSRLEAAAREMLDQESSELRVPSAASIAKKMATKKGARLAGVADEYADLRMDLADFTMTLTSMGLSAAQPKGLEHIFNQLDAASTGTIGYAQLVSSITDFVGRIPQPELLKSLKVVGAKVDERTPLEELQSLSIRRFEMELRRAEAKKRAPKGKGQAELAEAREMVKDMDPELLLDALTRAGEDVDELTPLDELHVLAARQLSSELLMQQRGKQVKEPTAAERAAKRLRSKSENELRVMLHALSVSHDQNATVKELRVLAKASDALRRWEELKPEEKLKWNQMLAIHNAKMHDAKQKHDRKEARERAADKRQLEREEKGLMHEMEPHPEWEVEWGPYDEEEALERLSRLPMWKNMLPGMLENMMKTIRGNPKVLEMFENEARTMEQMRDMMGPNGEMPTTHEMMEAGLDFDLHRFKENEKKAQEAKTAKEAAAATSADVVQA